MRNLISPDEDHLEIFKDIVGSKRSPRKEILDSLESSIKSSYFAYFSVLGELSKIIRVNNYSESQIEALLHCYNGSSKPLNKIKDQIYNLQPIEYRATCQYCGGDHYIPKELYPEYSVLPLNLIPCCPICNTIKSNKWLDTNNKRQFVNLYFDYITQNIRFLYAHIKYNGTDAEIDFQLEKPESISWELFELIEKHYRNLKLFDRYINKSNEYISEIKTALEIDDVNSKIKQKLRRS